ncbi:hypothetical protein GO755_34860 [Spirosoma sp. HMF4905]|uniref:Uncharacterized protein n=1 Tax=Spirosoma arboris TaxID=2682092 RepID=A0A7K1SN84_9BACT|nr:hypothetical protein [Spirosoma arboris]MVM35255.1 hypothetical protein [Spirosoma arboris]
MKKVSLSLVVFLLIGFMLSCQENKKDEAAVKPDKNGRARRACPNNSINYAFIKPDDDYTYNGDGCQSFYVHRGSTRQIKVKFANTTGSIQYQQMYIVMPYNPTSITYSVASVTGGATAVYTPYPVSGNGSSILWYINDASPYTTYELILNVTGVTGGPAAENGLHLVPIYPCTPTADTDCDADENMHLILTN